MASAKVIAALEAALNALKEEAGVAVDIALPPGRARAVMDYDGSDDVQNVVDCLRRAIRVNRLGRLLSKKERNVCRDAIKYLKDNADFEVLNTNGNDFLTQNGV